MVCATVSHRLMTFVEIRTRVKCAALKKPTAAARLCAGYLARGGVIWTTVRAAAAAVYSGAAARGGAA